jgi:hypothetical protein
LILSLYLPASLLLGLHLPGYFIDFVVILLLLELKLFDALLVVEVDGALLFEQLTELGHLLLHEGQPALDGLHLHSRRLQLLLDSLVNDLQIIVPLLLELPLLARTVPELAQLPLLFRDDPDELGDEPRLLDRLHPSFSNYNYSL